MCCQWWKNIVHPKYTLDRRTFESIINLIKKCPSATFLNLTIYDNNLSKEKLQLLSQTIKQTGIQRMSLNNLAL